MRDEFIWPEKYRPQTIAECILPKHLQEFFQSILKAGELPNMLLVGSSGLGKTTVARALCAELDADVLLINASEDSGIDTLRTKIRDFASTMSFNGKTKVVILDEADYLNINSTQPALRGFIEEFSASCRFILTANHPNRLLSAIHSRMVKVDFVISPADKPKLATKFMKRVKDILTKESVTFNEKVVAEILMRYFPDFRRILGELQRHAMASNSTIDVGALAVITNPILSDLIPHLKDQNFTGVCQWVVDNSNQDTNTLYRQFFDELLPQTTDAASLVLILHDYAYKSAFVADPELNMVACLTEVMNNCKFQ